MTSEKGVLKQFGFSRAQEQIYLTLLKKGGCSIAELAQLIGKHRPAVYKALPALLSANLVSKILKGKRIFFKAESPAALSVLTKRQIENVDMVLPKLLDIYQNKDKKSKISFFEGKEGIATAYEQLLLSAKKGEILYRYESPRDYTQNKRYYPCRVRERCEASALYHGEMFAYSIQLGDVCACLEQQVGNPLFFRQCNVIMRHNEECGAAP